MQERETGRMQEITEEEAADIGFTTTKYGFSADSSVFREGEVLQIKGGWWRVQKIWRGRMKLKSISAAEATREAAKVKNNV